jgi:hypothetical protein
MIKEFTPITLGIHTLIKEWEPRLLSLTHEVIASRRNSQNRTIRQILGHLIDSASNNIHRIVHLQYRENPMHFPNYAINGNNDRWIAIQHYQEEDWEAMVQLWKYSNLHWIHVVSCIDNGKLNNEWIADTDKRISLKTMVVDYLRHFKLHLDEIDIILKQF